MFYIIVQEVRTIEQIYNGGYISILWEHNKEVKIFQ